MNRSSTCRLLAAAAALAVVPALVAVPAHGTDETPPTPASTVPEPARLRIASFNTAGYIANSRALEDITALAGTRADVIALQEMGSYTRRTAVAETLADCETCLYDMYAPVWAPGSANTPILYRSDRFWLVGTGSRQVTPETYVGPRGAGPSTLAAKYVTWVHLKDRLTQRQVIVVNNHFVASVQGKDGGPNSNTARVTLYRKHMRGLKETITELRGTGAAIFVTGDFNVNYRTDSIRAARIFPYRGLGEVGVHASYERLGMPATGTHVLPSGYDKRLIDYVSILDHAAVVPVRQRILTGMNSDHRPLVLYARLRYKAKHFG